MLTVSQNKKQLIELVIGNFFTKKDSIEGKVVLTGSDPVPVEINGVVTRRIDLSVMHEEADTIILNQLLAVKPNQGLVIADDTDVFVLSCHFVNDGSFAGEVKMRSCKKSNIYIDINATVEKHNEIMGDLLPSHRLTGCDTVAVCYNIGKGKALKALKTRKYPLDSLGNISSSIDRVLKQATQFMLACYSHPECSSLTEARQKIWSTKVASQIASAPKLQSLPPTNEAFLQNVLRAHLQVAIWRKSADRHPPNLNPEDYGFVREGNSLRPMTVASDVALVPEDLLKVVKCGCSSIYPCQSRNCSCSQAGMPCTEFCKCGGLIGHCFNSNTTHSESEDGDEDNTDSAEESEDED